MNPQPASVKMTQMLLCAILDIDNINNIYVATEDGTYIGCSRDSSQGTDSLYAVVRDQRNNGLLTFYEVDRASYIAVNDLSSFSKEAYYAKQDFWYQEFFGLDIGRWSNIYSVSLSPSDLGQFYISYGNNHCLHKCVLKLL